MYLIPLVPGVDRWGWMLAELPLRLDVTRIYSQCYAALMTPYPRIINKRLNLEDLRLTI